MHRFGDFTFDPRSGDLTSPRGTTRLQPQAAAVLTMLVERAGSVVMRTELQQRLWPDTTVEFDDGLNTCVRQIRVALGDDANAPRFVETLPRRGYRFLGKVEVPGDSAARRLGDSAGDRPRRRLGGIAGAVASVVIVAALALSALRGRPTLSTPAVSLAIVPFSVDTTDLLMVKYQQGLMAQMAEDAKTESAWRVVGDSGQATHVLSGSLVRAGMNVHIFAQLVLARDKRHLWAEDIVDTYPFAGNSKIMGDRIEKNAARVLGDSASR